jgi:hypothetical protein
MTYVSLEFHNMVNVTEVTSVSLEKGQRSQREIVASHGTPEQWRTYVQLPGGTGHRVQTHFLCILHISIVSDTPIFNEKLCMINWRTPGHFLSRSAPAPEGDTCQRSHVPSRTSEAGSPRAAKRPRVYLPRTKPPASSPCEAPRVYVPDQNEALRRCTDRERSSCMRTYQDTKPPTPPALHVQNLKVQVQKI